MVSGDKLSRPRNRLVRAIQLNFQLMEVVGITRAQYHRILCQAIAMDIDALFTTQEGSVALMTTGQLKLCRWFLGS